MRTKVLLFFILMSMCHLGHAESLPKVDIHFSTLAKDTFNIGTFRLIQDSDTISLSMLIRRRGALSTSYDKPSYAVKLIDSIGLKVDTALLNMRSDNYWILDAMAIDRARMRNRVAMDLWLEFSRKPWYHNLEPKMINGYRGKMVEVYVNDTTQGIYCLMERVDRKQLKLKKYSEKKGVQGVLYKASLNTMLTLYWQDYRNPMPDSSSVWDGWEQSYPDMEDGEPMVWQPLAHHIQMCARTYNNAFSDSIAYHLDVPVYTDFVLLCNLLSARDNLGKNLFVSYYNCTTDERGVYTPWDMDHSWGIQCTGIEESADRVTDFARIYMYKRLISYYHFEDTLQARYAELRRTFFTIQHIDSLFAPYFELYARTGMDSIEAKLWSGHNDIVIDIPTEQQYIHNWVEQRLDFLDSVFHYTQPDPIIPTDMPTTTTTTTTKYWKEQRLYILRGKDRYDIYGRKIEDGE